MPKSNPSSPTSAFLTRTAAARFLGIGVTFLDKLIHTQELPAWKVGRRTVLVRREDLVRLATSRPVQSKRGRQ
jgi:excisionase family DNA binding protein